MTDLLNVLAAWGSCACDTTMSPVDSFCDALAGAGLNCMDAQSVINDTLDNGTPSEIDNMVCWLTHYIHDCNVLFCTNPGSCPEADPFEGSP